MAGLHIPVPRSKSSQFLLFFHTDKNQLNHPNIFSFLPYGQKPTQSSQIILFSFIRIKANSNIQIYFISFHTDKTQPKPTIPISFHSAGSLIPHQRSFTSEWIVFCSVVSDHADTRQVGPLVRFLFNIMLMKGPNTYITKKNGTDYLNQD